MKLNYFKEINFLPAIKALLKELNVPVNYISDEPTTAKEILEYTYKESETFQLISDVYFVGMVDDAAFEGNDSFDHSKIKSDYDGILFFGVELNKRENNLLPTRTQLADIARAFNREFHFTPVVVVFKYDNEDESFISFANTERIKFKQEWREGEKAGKVSLLRDISIEKPHRGHKDIIDELRITTSGKKAIRSFDGLYKHWQEVFNVNILNKRFYQELSNWYFWAIKNVTFPSEPTLDDVVKKYGKADHDKLAELINEHNATNVIRLLTRLLFTWFIKEKKLIPESLFDLDALQDDILKEINPYQQEGMFKHASTDSIYYKAILQNLFFASLNCPIEADPVDKRKRGFRGDGYGTHRGIDYLMRYKKQFKNPDSFLELMNQTVPFLNGGLFECLDDKYQNIYIDGFSDQMTQGQQLIVPDYLFFGLDTEVDLSQDYGSKNKKYKKAAVNGLINILKSYKFTITENTPIEEEVALDPELLGKVFENLLASYNPETKSTARKQTGSFYTPREIVNYMVDESLIAYLKNAFNDWELDEKEVDEKLHQLTSFDPVNPFEDNTQLSRLIIKNLDQCKILDPACGSGAFPMGILQKMVLILQKLDPTNEHWKEVQLEKAIQASKEAYDIEDKQERENKLIEINNAFDSNINDPDYARKLYLIENCIYGVDIQPIATQISKLRFFISLVVDQKKNETVDNFGIRALPNLETKFVTANTLIGIEKPSAQATLYDTDFIKLLEKKLKSIRHKLFGARTKDTKLKYRKKDEELRNAISEELKKSGWHNDTADKLASWDPYDQNASASYFDPEWMFDIKDGFDVVIGNPPYGISFTNSEIKKFRIEYDVVVGHSEAYYLFVEKGLNYLNKNGNLCYITPNAWFSNKYALGLRKYILTKYNLVKLLNFNKQFVFENAGVETSVFQIIKEEPSSFAQVGSSIDNNLHYLFDKSFWAENEKSIVAFSENPNVPEIWKLILKTNFKICDVLDISNGFKPYQVGYGRNLDNKLLTKEDVKSKIYHSKTKIDQDYKKQVKGKNLSKYKLSWSEGYIKWGPWLMSPKDENYYLNPKILIRQIISDTLLCTIDYDNYYADQSLYIGINQIHNDIPLEYICAFLNSRILGFYFRTFYSEDDALFPKIKVNELKSLPFWKTNEELTSVVSRIARIALNFDDDTSVLENVMDALFYEIILSEHMKDKEIDISSNVITDLNSIIDYKSINVISNEQFLDYGHNLSLLWSSPDNEVRNRMKLFAVRSPDILKPILES
jgi:hypothetical protein